MRAHGRGLTSWWHRGHVDCRLFTMPSSLRLIAPLALLIIISGGCSSRRDLFSAAPRSPKATALPVDTSRGDRAAARVKEAIRSLRREVTKRHQGAGHSLADLPPIPLIKRLPHERIVGTSGAWSVVQTTQTTPPLPHTDLRTGGQTWRDTARLNRSGIWLLLIAIVAAATIFTLRAQSGRRRLHS